MSFLNLNASLGHISGAQYLLCLGQGGSECRYQQVASCICQLPMTTSSPEEHFTLTPQLPVLYKKKHLPNLPHILMFHSAGATFFLQISMSETEQIKAGGCHHFPLTKSEDFFFFFFFLIKNNKYEITSILVHTSCDLKNINTQCCDLTNYC